MICPSGAVCNNVTDNNTYECTCASGYSVSGIVSASPLIQTCLNCMHAIRLVLTICSRIVLIYKYSPRRVYDASFLARARVGVRLNISQTCTPTYIRKASSTRRISSDFAERRKCVKYAVIVDRINFRDDGVETFGAFSQSARSLLGVATRITSRTGLALETGSTDRSWPQFIYEMLLSY